MTEDSKGIVKKIIESTSIDLKYQNEEILDTLYKYVDDGTIIGLKSGRIKKMSDSIIAYLRKKGDGAEY